MKNRIIEIKWAIIFLASGLSWAGFERFMGWHGEKIADHPTYTNLFALIAVLIYFLALWNKRNLSDGDNFTWKDGFISGMWITVMVTALTPISQYITHTWISPQYFDTVIKYAVKTGESTQEEAEAYFNLGSYIFQSVIFALIVGAVTSAVVAFFVKSGRKDVQ